MFFRTTGIELSNCLHPSEFDKCQSLLLCRSFAKLEQDIIGKTCLYGQTWKYTFDGNNISFTIIVDKSCSNCPTVCFLFQVAGKWMWPVFRPLFHFIVSARSRTVTSRENLPMFGKVNSWMHVFHSNLIVFNYSKSRLMWSLWARPKVITLTEW